jgi:hypothetical protein
MKVKSKLKLQYRATSGIFLPKPNAFELTRKMGAA